MCCNGDATFRGLHLINIKPLINKDYLLKATVFPIVSLFACMYQNSYAAIANNNLPLGKHSAINEE